MTCWIASGKWSLQFLVVDPANSDLKFPMIFHFWKSSHIFGWFKESLFSLHLRLYIWNGPVVSGKIRFWVLNSIQLLYRPIPNLMTYFAVETSFVEDLSDLLTKSGGLATSDQCQTHPHQPINLIASWLSQWWNTTSPKFSCSIESGAISYWQGHSSWIFLRCGRSDIWNFSTATLPLSKSQHSQCYLSITPLHLHHWL